MNYPAKISNSPARTPINVCKVNFIVCEGGFFADM